MANRKRSLRAATAVLAVIMVLLPLLSGCTASTVIDPRIRQALSGNSRAQDAVDWLVVNGDIVVPELVRRMGGGNNDRAAEAADALVVMGNYGLQGALKHFPQMNERGRQRVIDMLAKIGTEDAALRLLALSRYEDSFDAVTTAIYSMGDVALDFLLYQMNNEYYRDAVDACLVKFGEQSVNLIVEAVHSTNRTKVERAFTILQRIGEPAVAPLVSDMLENTEEEVDIEKAVSIMLSAYPETSISAIIDTATIGVGSQELASTLLDKIGSSQHMAYIINYTPQNATDAARGNLLALYLAKADVKTVVEMVLANPTEESLHGLELALSANYYSDEVISALLAKMTADDSPQSALYATAGRLLYDANYKSLAQSIIGLDANIMSGLLSSGTSAQFIGDTLSLASDNEVLIQRLDSMLFALPVDQRNLLMNGLAYANDMSIPVLLWNRFASDDSVLSANAASAIISAIPAGAKLPYLGMDFMPYVSKLISSLKSSDEQIKGYANDLLDRLPEGREHHDLYMQVFNTVPSQRVFIILAGHYGGAGGVSPNTTLAAGGEQVAPKTVSFTIKTDITGVSSSKYPDFKSIVEQSLPYLGLTSQADGAELQMDLDVDISPKYSWYSGNRGKYYGGATASAKLIANYGGAQVKSVNGAAIIESPEDPTPPSNTDDYKDDPENAPMEGVFRMCYMDSMFRMFGLDALLCLYNYDATSALAAADSLWN